MVSDSSQNWMARPSQNPIHERQSGHPFDRVLVGSGHRSGSRPYAQIKYDTQANRRIGQRRRDVYETGTIFGRVGNGFGPELNFERERFSWRQRRGGGYGWVFSGPPPPVALLVWGWPNPLWMACRGAFRP